LVRGLYALLLLSALSLGALVVGDIVNALTSGSGEHRDYPIFDLAWPVFLVSGSLTLVAGVGALVSGRLRGSAALTRYGAWALGYCAFAVLLVALLHPDFLSF
jgi:hypothetical protein